MTKNNVRTPHSMKIVFGIFMICIYFGMGALMFTDFFSWMPKFSRVFLGCLFVVYGIWRCWRQIHIVKVEIEEEKEEVAEREAEKKSKYDEILKK